ncbi:MAG: GSCFA domain-containing protein, partial [Flavobacteriales bacterium]
MKLTTEVEVGSSSFQLGLNDSIVVMGSCFAQEVGAWFESKRFNVCVNPNGILFHPSVMSRCL